MILLFFLLSPFLFFSFLLGTASAGVLHFRCASSLSLSASMIPLCDSTQFVQHVGLILFWSPDLLDHSTRQFGFLECIVLQALSIVDIILQLQLSLVTIIPISQRSLSITHRALKRRIRVCLQGLMHVISQLHIAHVCCKTRTCGFPLQLSLMFWV